MSTPTLREVLFGDRDVEPEPREVVDHKHYEQAREKLALRGLPENFFEREVQLAMRNIEVSGTSALSSVAVLIEARRRLAGQQ